MSSIKWSIYPVVKLTFNSLLIISVLFFYLEKIGLTQSDWIPIGTQDGLSFQFNPKVYKSGIDNSIVSYDLMITAPQEINSVRYSIANLIARCNSRQQALTQLETFNNQGQSLGVTRFDIHHRDDWETPKADVYGQAFNLACNRY